MSICILNSVCNSGVFPTIFTSLMAEEIEFLVVNKPNTRINIRQITKTHLIGAIPTILRCITIWIGKEKVPAFDICKLPLRAFPLYRQVFLTFNRFGLREICRAVISLQGCFVKIPRVNFLECTRDRGQAKG